ncbi:hypothetical protein PLESTF_000830300 [Pleodorina starrii]|nr:hypothetical protein PLESTM_000897100 [Pleodorina starrii]GLC69434.1 hypothetical protein PLESTF_000830300 [Pleodorina starrii]
MEQRITDLEATLVTARANQTAAETAKAAAEDRAENAEEMAKQLELVVDQADPSTRHYPNSSHHQPEQSPTAPWSFIRARLETSITYIKDNIQPELRQSSSALVYVGMALGMLKEAQQVNMAMCHGINTGFRRYSAAAKTHPRGVAVRGGLPELRAVKVGRTQEVFPPGEQGGGGQCGDGYATAALEPVAPAPEQLRPRPVVIPVFSRPTAAAPPSSAKRAAAAVEASHSANTTAVEAVTIAGVAAISAGATAHRRRTGCRARAVAQIER